MTTEPAPLRRTWALPVAGWVATTGAVLAILIGIGYDIAEREPGRFAASLILSGLALMTGAPWLLLGVWSGQVRRWAASHDQRPADDHLGFRTHSDAVRVPANTEPH